jgi:hypothetical protein
LFFSEKGAAKANYGRLKLLSVNAFNPSRLFKNVECKLQMHLSFQGCLKMLSANHGRLKLFNANAF